MTATRPEQPTPAYVPGHGLLQDKVVVVTAAAGAGIGASAVRRSLEEGARLAVLSDTHERRVAEAHEALAGEFGADRVVSTVTDVTDEDQVAALLDLADQHGGVDVMINNAGLGGTASVLEMTDEQWSRVLDITLTGTFRCVRAASKRMIANAARGVIVAGDAPFPGQGDLRRAAPRAQAARGVRARRRAVGGRERDGVPRE
jgi:3-oxoacyl-[acyl-carrier protein] reductase